MLGACLETAAALLLYTQHGFLGTAGFLIALALAALSLGLWVGAESATSRRWISAVFAYVAAAVFAVIWSVRADFRQAALGGALAAFFLIGEPAYTTAAAYQVLARRGRASSVAVFLGAAGGALAAAILLIPRLRPSVIFVGAAAVLLAVALYETRRASQHMESNPTLPLQGKTAVVTGVSDRGQVGYAVAHKLIAAGARVCVTSRHENIGEIARELGAGTVGVQCDLLMEDDVARLLTTAREKLGGIDILVNVAGGLSVIKPLADTSREEWQQESQRNAETVFLVSRAALPALRERRGRIINFASPAGERAVARLSAYSAAKAGVIALTRALAIEEKNHGVRVNAIAPGMIDTKSNRSGVDDPNAVQWVTREEIAAVVVFLASDAASGITGETISVLGKSIS